MRYIEFGPGKAKVSELVLGTMRIAQMQPKEVATLIETALDAGVNAVETAFGCKRSSASVLIRAQRPTTSISHTITSSRA